VFGQESSKIEFGDIVLAVLLESEWIVPEKIFCVFLCGFYQHSELIKDY
jgi:hypothetical protein